VSFFRLAGARRKYPDPGVIRIDVGRRQHVPGDRLRQGTQELARGRGPLHEGRGAQGEPSVREHSALAVERQVEGKLPAQDHGEHRGAGEARGIGPEGAGACTMVEQREQRFFGRM